MCYRWLSVFFVLTVVFPTTLATPLVQPWHDISTTGSALVPLPAGITIDLHIALQPQEENVLMEALYEVSTPGRPKYGKYLSKEEVAKLVKPHPDTLDLVHSWPAHHGVPSSSISTSHGGGWLTVTDVAPTALTKNAIGILGYGNEFPSPTDLNMFMTVFRSDSDLDEVTFTVETYAQAMAYPTPHIFYSIGGTLKWSLVDNQPVVGDFFLMWMAYLVPKEKIPQTMSASYSINEKEVPAEYARSVCDIFMQLGARGVSILFASGDDGVGVGNCQDASGRVQFIPKFPATCPYVTSVGGTMSSNPEVAAGLSGGGFSTRTTQITKVKCHSRSALVHAIILATETLEEGGNNNVLTVAGIISMLNDFLISEGKDPLGFLNPWLYTNEEGMSGLNDITSGSNPGCDTDGFTSIPG
ncbi:peptidase S8/S53 domain-containing protein [Lactarius vividus]|nr:peptidase S8/S53 domain-containing protein [Lactarius vividus]